ncbi:MAG: glycosyltransferase [Planctomycetota bacterium]|jgi:glycosyltransferase involved in cell wall biosynthesis
MQERVASIVIPCGPRREAVLDTADSIAHYCYEPHDVIFVDDCTCDGTYQALLDHKKDNWHILRNPRVNGYHRIVQTLCLGFRYVLERLRCRFALKLDTDSLIIRCGALTDALNYMNSNPQVGAFGVYEKDYNRARSYSVHGRLIDKEMAWWRRALGLRPYYHKLLNRAEKNGYRRGDNVFGGALFITHDCLSAIHRLGGLDVPYRGHSRLGDEIYFSMATVAAGYRLGHFAAPDGPLCLEYRGLPYPAIELWQRGYKIVHSVDKGPNTTALENAGVSARQFYRNKRRNEKESIERTVHA